MWERVEVEVFLALAEELHFGRTAERLGLTTGRVSQVVRKLERRVGGPLFERTSRSVRLTAVGGQLAQELAPAVEAVELALRRAVDAGRGVTGELRVAFLGEFVAPVLLKVAALFTERHPDCRVDVREVQLFNSRTSLEDGSVDVLVASFPFDGMANGPALLTERRALAVPAGHPLAGRESVSLEVLGDHPVVQYPPATSAGFKRDRTPDRTPSGRPVTKGPEGSTFSEMLSLVAMGKGVLPVGEHARRYYPRPDLAYVPLCDAAPIRRGPVWVEAHANARIRAFVQAAADVAAADVAAADVAAAHVAAAGPAAGVLPPG
ncbi:LysR family transcriptional regulator [Streptacidiphilus jiangxiensis]|uniref:DNA-binding transcriptional regulator, LysR family n=1 Tax=Streptacidiphilus jiangxiensis TaxID=235985 RepID=A0A1H7J7A6_STRJI|nr:LysR family transcriptional regulator [Streptacidiphilus jiangxiensis]SEK70558.1 DNA-binding transcriptional regulator, LysR family [Streptacidiphilus jiangxiensis]